MFTGNHFMQFEDAFNFIEVMDYSKILCIGFDMRIDIYNIEENPLYPKLIESIENKDKMREILKLDEQLLLLVNKNQYKVCFNVICFKNYNYTMKKVILLMKKRE